MRALRFDRFGEPDELERAIQGYRVVACGGGDT
jgi:hypothetical protein